LLKNKNYFLKNSKNRLSVEPLFASGGWGLRPRPRIITPVYYYNFVEFIPSDKSDFYPLQKKQNNYSKCSAFASSILFHLFFTSNSVVFVDGGYKNTSCPRAQETLATPLLEAGVLTTVTTSQWLIVTQYLNNLI